MDILVSSLEDECAEQGKDWEEVLEQRAEEDKVMKRLGIERKVQKGLKPKGGTDAVDAGTSSGGGDAADAGSAGNKDDGETTYTRIAEQSLALAHAAVARPAAPIELHAHVESPDVVIHEGAIQVSAPAVNVESPHITVPVSVAAPEVQVHQPRKTVEHIERGADKEITRITRTTED